MDMVLYEVFQYAYTHLFSSLSGDNQLNMKRKRKQNSYGDICLILFVLCLYCLVKFTSQNIFFVGLN